MNLRKFARGQPCTLRLPGICNGNPETTVLAHGRGAGMGTKLRDYIGVHACSDCHSYLDSCDSAEFDRVFPPALLETLGRAYG